MQPTKTRKILALALGVLAYIFVMMLSGCSTFAILPDHGDDDAYAVNKKYLKNQKKVTFIEITAKDLLESPSNEIYLFSNWCPHCFLYLKELTPKTKGNVKYISPNYDIRFMRRNFLGLDTIYILSNAAYGTVESQKILAFGSQITMEVSENSGLPQRFVWNAEKRKYEYKDGTQTQKKDNIANGKTNR